MKKALIINGSPRNKGNTGYIAGEIQSRLIKMKIKTDSIDLRKLKFTSCIGCEKCRKFKKCTGLKDDMTDIYPLIQKADLLVVGSPVHNYNISAMLKAFIDRLYCYYDFSHDRPRKYKSRLAKKGKKLISFAIAEQTNKKDFGFALEAINLPLETLGYEIILNYKIAGFFDKGSVSKDKELIKGIDKDIKKVII